MSLPAQQHSAEVSSPPVPPLTPIGSRPARDARYDWAAERTLLSWVRTGLAMMGFGFIVARFGAFLRALGLTAPGALPPDIGNSTASMVAGMLLVAIGMAANLLAVHRFLRNHRALTRGEPVDPSPAGPATLALLMALVGAALVLMLGHTLLP